MIWNSLNSEVNNSTVSLYERSFKNPLINIEQRDWSHHTVIFWYRILKSQPYFIRRQFLRHGFERASETLIIRWMFKSKCSQKRVNCDGKRGYSKAWKIWVIRNDISTIITWLIRISIWGSQRKHRGSNKIRKTTLEVICLVIEPTCS